MKKRDFVKYLVNAGCFLKREGANHEIWVNPSNQKWSTVPRHPEVKRNLCQKICKDLGIESPF